MPYIDVDIDIWDIWNDMSTKERERFLLEASGAGKGRSSVIEDYIHKIRYQGLYPDKTALDILDELVEVLR